MTIQLGKLYREDAELEPILEELFINPTIWETHIFDVITVVCGGHPTRIVSLKITAIKKESQRFDITLTPFNRGVTTWDARSFHWQKGNRFNDLSLIGIIPAYIKKKCDP